MVADATHLNEGSRHPVLELGKQYGAETVALVMNTSYETCIIRNNEREGDDLVPKEVIRNMAQIMRNLINLKVFIQYIHIMKVKNTCGIDCQWKKYSQ